MPLSNNIKPIARRIYAYQKVKSQKNTELSGKNKTKRKVRNQTAKSNDKTHQTNGQCMYGQTYVHRKPIRPSLGIHLYMNICASMLSLLTLHLCLFCTGTYIVKVMFWYHWYSLFWRSKVRDIYFKIEAPVLLSIV